MTKGAQRHRDLIGSTLFQGFYSLKSSRIFFKDRILYIRKT